MWLFCCNLHGACGGKACHRVTLFSTNGCCNLHGACGGKAATRKIPLASRSVAICTERVEAKNKDEAKARHAAELQSARSVWRQSACCLQAQALTALQSARSVWRQSGKVRCAPGERMVAICTERVEAKFFRASVDYAFEVLQSARSVWRQSANHCARGKHSARCNLHVACRETERHHPPEKNPRKFMQTYCIFIHLGV